MAEMIHENIPPTTDVLLTGEALAEMGDIGRCELVEGRLIKMRPTGWRHGSHESNFDRLLAAFVNENNLGKVLVSEVGLYTRRNPDTVRGADVIFISNERLAQVKSASFLDVAPELIVEVMSPDDRWTEVKQKLKEYFSIGVNAVWVADPSDKTVSVYRSLTEVNIFSEDDSLTGDDILPGFSVSVASLFTD